MPLGSIRRKIQQIPFENLESRTLLAIDVDVNIDTSNTFQTIRGFGATMASNNSRKEYNGSEFYDLITDDLGASIARAAVWPSFEQKNDDDNPDHFNWSGFDMDAIAHHMTFFQRLQERGVKKFALSIWTPPYWMKTNNGYSDAGTVRPDKREEFAEYVAAVVIAAKENWGITINQISLQNEPYLVLSYDSAVATAQQMRELIRATQKKFDAEGLDTGILVPEELITIDRYKYYIDTLMADSEIRNSNITFAAHGYSSQQLWKDIAAIHKPYDHEFWMTETSSQEATWNGAMDLAENIYQTVAVGQANAYLYWQWTDKAAASKYALMIDGNPTTKYYAAKHYFKYIRPGDKRVEAKSTDADVSASAYQDPDTGRTTIVLVNDLAEVAEIDFNIDGSNLPNNYTIVRSSAGEQAVEIGTISGQDGFKLTLPAQSIVTLYSGNEYSAPSGQPGQNLPVDKLFDSAKVTKLHEAALKGNYPKVEELLQSHPEWLNYAAADGWTPLHSAAASPYVKGNLILNLLIDSGANIHATTVDGLTPLHVAVSNAFPKFDVPFSMPTQNADDLIAAGADEDAQDSNGRTPLHWAAMVGKINKFSESAQIVTHLIARNAKVNATDVFGKTPLDYAIQEQYTLIRDELIRAGGEQGNSNLPTANVKSINPNPRTTPVNSIDIVFSEPVTGVSLSDFILKRSGGSNLLPGDAQLDTNDNVTWTLSNLSSLTTAAGAYVLTLKANGSNIEDASGNPLASDNSESWTVTAPGSGTGSPHAGVIVSQSSITVDEGSFDTFTVRLIEKPDADVLVNITKKAGGDADLTTNLTVLVFTPDNWNEPQTVRVLAASDADTSNGSAVFVIDPDRAPNKEITATEVDDNGPGDPPDPVVTKIFAKADAYVRADNDNRNYGESARLHAKTESSKSRRFYLKFDISDLATDFTSAKLKLFGAGPSGGGDIVASVHAGKKGTWSENQITWANQLGARKPALDSAMLTGSDKKWYSFNVADYIRQRLENGKKTATLVIKAKPNSALWALFNSSEASGRPPRLVVE